MVEAPISIIGKARLFFACRWEYYILLQWFQRGLYILCVLITSVYFTVCCKSPHQFRRQFFCSRTKLGNISTASPLASSREFSPSLPNTALILLTTISALISTRLRIYLLVLSASRSRLTRSQRFVWTRSRRRKTPIQQTAHPSFSYPHRYRF